MATLLCNEEKHFAAVFLLSCVVAMHCASCVVNSEADLNSTLLTLLQNVVNCGQTCFRVSNAAGMVENLSDKKQPNKKLL